MGDLALGVGHFRLEPEAQFETALLGLLDKISEALGKLVPVPGPVAQTGGAVVAGKFALGEPAVVDDKHFAADSLHAVHHVEQDLVGEIEVGAFPAVQEYTPEFMSPGNAVVAGPSVEIAGDLSLALIGISKQDLGESQRSTRFQNVGAGKIGGAGVDVQIVVGVVQ